MDKRHTENIQDFISRKIQKARNQVDNGTPKLALETLAEVENDIKNGVRIGLLPRNE